MANTPQIDPLAWALGVLGTITLGWVGTTYRKQEATAQRVNDHAVEIAVLKEGQSHIKDSLNRLEDHFGTKPKE